MSPAAPIHAMRPSRTAMEPSAIGDRWPPRKVSSVPCVTSRSGLARIIGTKMGTLFAADALLPSGWSRDVLLEWGEHGTRRRVRGGARREGDTAAGLEVPGM